MTSPAQVAAYALPPPIVLNQPLTSPATSTTLVWLQRTSVGFTPHTLQHYQHQYSPTPLVGPLFPDDMTAT